MPGKIAADSKRDAFHVHLLDALNATSQASRTTWVFFVSFLAYAFVAVSSVSHTDLLLNRAVKLPILQIEVQLTSFFVVVPLLMILMHFGLLLHHLVLVDKASALNSSLERVMDHENVRTARLQVNSYFFAQAEAGPDRGEIAGILFRSLTVVTQVIGPVIFLMYCQFQYLPQHDPVITWVHRAYILIDVLMLLIVGSVAESLRRRSAFYTAPRSKRQLLWVSLALVAFSSLCVATLPSGSGDPVFDLDRAMTRFWPTQVPFGFKQNPCSPNTFQRCAFWLTAFIFEQPIDYVSGRRGIFSRNLVVTDKDRLGQAGTGDQPRISLRGRDLRYATLDRSDLSLLDFTAADLSGSSLNGADLKNSIFACAVKGRKTIATVNADGKTDFEIREDLTCPLLTGADLTEAKLGPETLRKATVSGIVLKRTKMEGFHFNGLDLSNADLSDSIARFASFADSVLDGANLSGISAEGASFERASMYVTDLNRARLDGARLRQAELRGARLTDASLIGADLSGALLFGANMSRVHIRATTASDPKAYLLADVADLQVAPAGDSEKRLRDASARFRGISGTVAENSFLLDQAIESSKAKEWEQSTDIQVWRQLSARGSSDESDKRIGQYLAEFGCTRLDLIPALIRTHFTYPSFDFAPYRAGRAVAPPGITEEEIAAIKEKGGYGWAEIIVDPREYFSRPVVVAAFRESVAAQCLRALDSELKIDAVLIRTIEEAKRANSAENVGPER
jgi:uncharacterized protein YjbI with pentapeptide repeats